MFTCSENLNFIELHQFSTNKCSFFSSDPGEHLNKDSKCDMLKSAKYKRKKGKKFFSLPSRSESSFFLFVPQKKGGKGRKLLAS